MAELRRDPYADRRTLFAPERNGWPRDTDDDQGGMSFLPGK